MTDRPDSWPNAPESTFGGVSGEATLDEVKVNEVFESLADALKDNPPEPEAHVHHISMEDWVLITDMPPEFTGGKTQLVNRKTGDVVDITAVVQSIAISGNVWSTPKVRLRFVALPMVIMTALEDLMVSELEELTIEDRETVRRERGV